MSAPFELPTSSFSSLADLLNRELLQIPDRSLLLREPLARLAAIDWLFKIRDIHGFHFLTVALSVNYLDRFLSLHPLPEGKAWMLQLLSVACLSLAAKMEETAVPLSSDLQVESDCVFEARTIQRMELLVLSTLEWRMNSVTPFSYVSYFVHILGISPDAPRHALASRTNELLLCAMKEVTFTAYRPSSVAAAAILCALQSTLPPPARCSECKHRSMLLSALPEDVQAATERCYERMWEMLVMGKPISMWEKNLKKNGEAEEKNGNENWSAAAVVERPRPRSPAGVLEAATLTFSSSSNNSSESHGDGLMTWFGIWPDKKKKKKKKKRRQVL